MWMQRYKWNLAKPVSRQTLIDLSLMLSMIADVMVTALLQLRVTKVTTRTSVSAVLDGPTIQASLST